MPLNLRESNNKKGCKIELICAGQPPRLLTFPSLVLNLVDTSYGLKCLPELQRTVWGEEKLAMARDSPKKTVLLL